MSWLIFLIMSVHEYFISNHFFLLAKWKCSQPKTSFEVNTGPLLIKGNKEGKILSRNIKFKYFLYVGCKLKLSL